MKPIPLTGKHGAGKVTFVSEEDYERFKDENLTLNPVTGYVEFKRGKRTMYLSREILGLQPGQRDAAGRKILAEHANRDKLNNTRQNLRRSDSIQNAGNCKLAKNNTSGCRGVSWNKRKRKWVARIICYGRWKHLGYFDDLTEAAKAYDRAAIAHFGPDFARLNFPPPKEGEQSA